MGVISVDVSELEAWKSKINSLTTTRKDAFFHTACVDLASRLIALVKPLTPVNRGVLRMGWDTAAAALANPLAVANNGSGTYSVSVTNDTPYASYVEYGHRQTPGRYVPAIGKRLKASWVNGKHMLQMAESDLSSVAPGILEKKLEEFLKGGGF